MQAVINGIMLGGFYALMVLGFSIIWGVMGVINLAHGEFIMAGAYTAWFLNERYGWEPLASLIVAFILFFLIGYILQRILINRIIDRPHLISLLVTFGLAIIMAGAVNLRLRRGEGQMAIGTAVVMLMTLFVVYGRYSLGI